MEDFKSIDLPAQFPLLGTHTYVNTAASGLLPKDLLHWRREHDEAFFKGGSGMKMEAMLNLLPDVHGAVAHFFGCPARQVALTPNFSLGWNLLLDGLDSRHKVLLLEGDYPSVNWPFEDREFSIHKVPIGPQTEELIFDTVEREKISVVAFSLVQWIDGFRIEMDFLRRLGTAYPELLLMVDGTQFCGTETFDFSDSPIDVLGCSGYKWLLAGYGNGFFLLKDRTADFFKVGTSGFNSVAGDVSKRDAMALANRLEPGHLDTLNFGSLKFALDWLTDLGMDRITARTRYLGGKVRDALVPLGLLDNSISERPSHGCIFNITGGDALFKHLKEHKVLCSRRGNGIRLSFHWYNSENDLDKVLEVCKSV